MARPQKHDPEIDVLPYMDSMVITLNMVCLIIVIMMVPIIENAKQVRSMSFEKLMLSKEGRRIQEMVPLYLDCRPDGVTILPGDIHVNPEELIQPGNQVEQVLNRVRAKPGEEYIILVVRPRSLPVYRYVRREVTRRQILTGFDILDGDVVLDWNMEAKKLRLNKPGA